MDRRKALALSGAVTLTVAAAALAIGANLGMFGLAGRSEPVGQLSPATAVTRPVAGAPAGQGQELPAQLAPGTTGGHDLEGAGDDDHGERGDDAAEAKAGDD